MDLPEKFHQKILGYEIIATNNDLLRLVNVSLVKSLLTNFIEEHWVTIIDFSTMIELLLNRKKWEVSPA